MIKIVIAQQKDVEDILCIEQELFSRPWSAEGIQAELDSEDVVFAAAKSADAVVGFCVLHSFGDEGEIFNIAVKSEMQKQNIGSCLLDFALRQAENCGIKRVFLEVRDSNTPARRLYEKYGFTVVGRRKNYYDDPTEDAVLMQCELMGQEEKNI